MVTAALLHDRLEDCGNDADFLRQRGYSEDCIRMIGRVTKPDSETRSEVIDDLIASSRRRRSRRRSVEPQIALPDEASQKT